MPTTLLSVSCSPTLRCCRAVLCCAILCCAVLQGLTYDQAQATINGTVSVQVPHWLEVLLHHSNYHLPAHVSISIPSYNLPAAQVSTKTRHTSLFCFEFFYGWSA